MSKNYFEIFDLELKLTIDLVKLRQKYFELQKIYHPDSQNHNDLEMCLKINEGYRILSSDILRTSYLLELENIFINKENTTIKPKPEILILALEKREELENESDINNLRKIQKDAQNKFNDLKDIFEKLYLQKTFNKAAEIAIEMQYMNKLIEETISKINKILEEI
ncbi:MAG: Fe-S protein assembly co-chaperone HscB [Sphingobacteriia bacterium]|nr:Fe-S protein assembly co-chaperone HscB [Sphingobacteriia bacterium]